jgi:hypothetical protein
MPDTLPDSKTLLFTRVIERAYHVSPNLIYKLAKDNDVDIPFDLSSPSEVSEFLLKELPDHIKLDIIDKYGDAGNVLSYYFTFGDEITPLEDLKKKSVQIRSLKEESDVLEDVPYFDEVEIHPTTQTLRVRFHYYKGKTFLLDEEAKTIRQFRKAFYGVVIFRPSRKLVEVRAKHMDLARKVAQRTTTVLGMQVPVTLDFRKQECIKRFLDWIRSLNNARIEFSIREAKSSLIINARSGIDLKQLQDFKDALEHGKLRGGHATVEKSKGEEINFRIFFRDCRVYFTSFCTESDIDFVTDAIEKITEGYKFVIPKGLLEKFFEQSS